MYPERGVLEMDFKCASLTSEARVEHTSSIISVVQILDVYRTPNGKKLASEGEERSARGKGKRTSQKKKVA